MSETGNVQYENVDGVDKYLSAAEVDEGVMQRGGPGRLMMLPTDIALTTDASFKEWVDKYAADEALFFADFAEAYGKLMCLGCPAACDPFTAQSGAATGGLDEKLGAIAAEMRERAMHGSVEFVAKLCDELATMPGGAGEKGIQSKDASSGRNALHKAAFWVSRPLSADACFLEPFSTYYVFGTLSPEPHRGDRVLSWRGCVERQELLQGQEARGCERA